MAESFNTTTSALEQELINLILEGQIQARIDSQNKVRKNIMKMFVVVKIIKKFTIF